MEILALLGLAYFMPTVVAALRGHHNGMAIFVLNLFLGWTLLGWIAAAVWSVTAKRPKIVTVRPVGTPGGLDFDKLAWVDGLKNVGLNDKARKMQKPR